MLPSPPPNRTARLGAGTAVAFGFLCAGAPSAYAHALRPTAQIRPIPDPISSVANETPYERGKRLLVAGDVAAGLTVFRQALLDQPDSADILDGVAVCYDRLGRPDLAETYYEAALRIDPKAARLHNNLGYSLLLSGRKDEAVTELLIAAAGDDERAAGAARETLATIRAGGARPMGDDMYPPAEQPYVETVAAKIERTTEGEQRLVIGRDAREAAPAGLEADAALIAVSRPWRPDDDLALTAEAETDAARQRFADEAAVRRASRWRETAPAFDVEPAVMAIRDDAWSRTPTRAAAFDGFAAPMKTPTLGSLAGTSEIVSNVSLIKDPNAGPWSSELTPERLSGPHDANRAQPQRPFDSDDHELNAFATRMRAARGRAGSQWS